ncbi:MAG: hypothetical protein V3U96_00495 [Paracoccaceae bacterium]
MRKIFLVALLPLVGCVSAQELCIANAGKDIRVLSGLIATTQANITRGYAIHTEEFFDNELQLCGVIEGEEVYCEVAVAYSRNIPVAIDLNVEQAKLTSLIKKQAELSNRANSVIAQCQAQYPET